MPADPHPPGTSPVPWPGPNPGRLVTTSEAAVLLGLDEGALWRLLDDSGVRVHVMQERDGQKVAIELRDLLYLRAHPALGARPRPTRLAPAPPPVDATGHEVATRHDRLAFELELLRAQHANARERVAQLEQNLRARLTELEATQAALEVERGQRLQREILKSHLARVGERLEGTEARLGELEQELEQADQERDRQLTELVEARDAERAVLCAERGRLEADLVRAGQGLESLRRAVLVGQAERDALRAELETARQVERATQSYCDRLEQRLRAPGA